MLADARGRPLWFLVTPGQTGDILAAPVLLESQQDEAVLAEKADDSNARGDRFTVMGAARTSRQTECEQLSSPRSATLSHQKPDRTLL